MSWGPAARQRPDETPQLTPRQVCASLLVWHDRRRDDGRLLEALEFAKLAESLFPTARDMPQDLVLRLAETMAPLPSLNAARVISALPPCVP